jgi:hypothetical protein
MEMHRWIKRTIVIGSVLAAACVIVMAAFSIWYVVSFYPRPAESFEVNSPDLSKKILVATQGSEFKDGLVDAFCARLAAQPMYVKVIDVSGLDDVDTNEWSKVLVINTAMMNIMSGPARRLVARREGLDNVLLLITSGGGDFKPTDLEVDALSGASRTSDTNRLVDLLLAWAEADESGQWRAGDQVVALEYFLQVDAEAACSRILSERDRYQQLYPDLQRRLNVVGYDFLRRNLTADALHAFTLNRELFPQSWNVYDSYAEALLASGDREGAIANYAKAVELNPDREVGRRLLAELRSGQ